MEEVGASRDLARVVAEVAAEFASFATRSPAVQVAFSPLLVGLAAEMVALLEEVWGGFELRQTRTHF